MNTVSQKLKIISNGLKPPPTNEQYMYSYLLVSSDKRTILLYSDWPNIYTIMFHDSTFPTGPIKYYLATVKQKICKSFIMIMIMIRFLYMYKQSYGLGLGKACSFELKSELGTQHFLASRERQRDK